MDVDKPTGTVAVELGPGGEPHYAIAERVAWDGLVADSAALDAARAANAVCFGTLAQREESARSAIHKLVSAAQASALRVCDINLRPPFIDRDVIEQSLEMANVLKLNEEELHAIAGMFGLHGDTHAKVTALVHRYDLSMVALTRGEKGSHLFADGRWSDQGGVPVKVRDSVGAGDAFTAVLITGLLAGWPLHTINRRANEIAAYVCTHAGATPDLPEFLRTEASR